MILVLVSLPGSYTRLIAVFRPKIMSSLDSLLTSVLSHKSTYLDTLILIYFIEDNIVTLWFATYERYNLDSIPISLDDTFLIDPISAEEEEKTSPTFFFLHPP